MSAQKRARTTAVRMALRQLALYSLYSLPYHDAAEAWRVVVQDGTPDDRVEALTYLADRLMARGQWFFSPGTNYSVIVGLGENDGKVLDLTSHWPKLY